MSEDDESYYDVDVYNIAKLVRDVGASLGEVLRGLYRMQKEGILSERWAIVNPACSPDDIAGAEARIDQPLAPLHRELLLLSNGGTLPFVTGIGWLASAIAREHEWRISGPFVESGEPTHIINVRQQRPIAPIVLGASLEQVFAGKNAHELPLDNFIPFAGGYGGEVWGYVHGEPGRIDIVVPPSGRGIEAYSFEAFLLWQTLYDECAEMDFREALSAVLG